MEGFDMCFPKQTGVPPGSLLLGMECPAKNLFSELQVQAWGFGVFGAQHLYSLNFWMLVVGGKHWSWLPARPAAVMEKDSGRWPLNVKQPC